MSKILILFSFIAITSCSSRLTAPRISKVEVVEETQSDSISINQASTEDAPLDSVQTLLGKINLKTKALDQEKSNKCPGLDLVISCGNAICESNKGEDANSCAPDCVPALVRSYNNQTLCTEVGILKTPTNASEVASSILEAKAKGMKVKVVGQSHSANEILCTKGMVISTSKFNKPLGVTNFEGEMVVSTEPGIILFDLAEYLHKQHLSLGFNIMGFRGVSVAGAIGTGSHGSSAKHTAVISNIVQGLTLVNAQGEIKEYSKGTTDPKTWRALTASFGLLGIVTEVKLKVQPQFNLDVQVSYGHQKKMFGPDGVFGVVSECDYGQLNWFPGAKHFVKTCGKITDKKADAGATNALLDPAFPNWFVKPVKQIMQYGACNNGVACFMDQMRYAMMVTTPPFKKNNWRGKLKASKHVIGPSHRMMSSVLTSHQAGFFQMDWEIAVPKSRAEGAMKAVLNHIKKNKICLPLVGVFLRFAPSESESLMAHTTSQADFIEGEPVVFIEMPVYLPVGFNAEQKANYDRVFEEFAKFLIKDHGARAHWGKNRDWLFKFQAEQGVYGDNLKDFLDVVHEMDPDGLFANKFLDNMSI